MNSMNLGSTGFGRRNADGGGGENAGVEDELHEDWFLVYRVLSEYPDAFRALDEAMRMKRARGRPAAVDLCWRCRNPLKKNEGEGAENGGKARRS